MSEKPLQHFQIEVREVNECLKQHQALSEAEVEYQRKFDAVKDFELLLLSKPISNVLRTLNEWDNLLKEERDAYRKLESARRAYKECLTNPDRH